MGDKKENTYIYSHAIDELIGDILKAEHYNLPNLLTACTKNAYKVSYQVFIKGSEFHRISSDTKSKIFMMRCEKLDLVIVECSNVLGRMYSYGRCTSCEDRKRVIETKSILNFDK